MHLHVIVLHVEGDVGHVQEIIGEILLDDIALVAGTNNEVVDAIGGVTLEDMPENGPPADLNHRLGFEMGFFTDARAKTTG